MEADDEQQVELDPLGRVARATAVVIGVVLTGAGVIAVFVSENSVGTGVVLAIGAFFLLVGVTGHSVASARLGDAEVRFRRLARQVAATLDLAPGEVKVELAEAIVEAEPAASDPLARRAAGILAERDMLDALDELLRRDESLKGFGWVYAGPHDFAADGYIAAAPGPPIAVILKAWQTPLRADALAEAVRRLQPEHRRILLVSASGFTVRARASADLIAAEGTRLRLVDWRSPERLNDLRRALRSFAANGTRT